jgi:hypothetical protein
MREHRVAFDGIEQIRVLLETAPEAGRTRKERVGCQYQPGSAALQPSQILEGRDALCGTARKVQQQDMSALDGSLDPVNQDDAACLRVCLPRIEVQLVVVQRDGERVVSERRRAIDQLAGVVRDRVNGVVCRVGVESTFSIPPVSLAINMPRSEGAGREGSCRYTNEIPRAETFCSCRRPTSALRAPRSPRTLV